MNFAILAAKLVSLGMPLLAQAVNRDGPKATQQIAARLGTAEATPEVVAQAVDAQDPDDLLALRALEYEEDEKQRQHVERLADKEDAALATQEANIRAARETTPDLNNARLVLFGAMLAVLVASVSGLTWVWLTYDGFPAELFALIGTVIGMFMSKVGGGWDYFFGTSSGSAAKERNAQAERMIVAERGRR